MTIDYKCPSFVAHCDWSMHPKKRWMAVARRQGDGWRLEQPEPVGSTDDLFARLQARASGDGSIFVGFDFPIGLPSTYGKLTGLSDFRSALEVFGKGSWAQWYRVGEVPGDISVYRPFYPQRPGGTRREHLLHGIGLDDYNDLLRACDRATDQRPPACSLFWTLGGNQVGKGAISGWRELLSKNVGRLGLWPFDGNLVVLLNSRPVVVAETYPGDVYGQIGIPRKPVWSKRKPQGRASVGQYLHAVIQRRGHLVDAALHRAIADGFSMGSEGEDQFDAFVGLLGMLEVVDGHRAEGCPDDPAIREWEGWILGHARGHKQTRAGEFATKKTKAKPRPVADAKGMIEGMNPKLRSGHYVFCSVKPDSVAPDLLRDAIATFREEEGLSLILPIQTARAHGVSTDQPMRLITLQVHSSLTGVGLTAAVATALKSEDIPCNVVAATFHDHVFVPAELAQAALEALERLQGAP